MTTISFDLRRTPDTGGDASLATDAFAVVAWAETQYGPDGEPYVLTKAGRTWKLAGGVGTIESDPTPDDNALYIKIARGLPEPLEVYVIVPDSADPVEFSALERVDPRDLSTTLPSTPAFKRELTAAVDNLQFQIDNGIGLPTDEGMAEVAAAGGAFSTAVDQRASTAAAATVTPMVPPLVTEALAESETLQDALDEAIAGRPILEGGTVESTEVAFAVVDDSGRRSWIESDAAGRPTPHAADLLVPVVGPKIGPQYGTTDQNSAVTGVAFAITDADGRRSELEVGPDGKLTQRVIVSIASRLGGMAGARTPEPSWSPKVASWDPSIAAYNLHARNLGHWATRLDRARAGLGTAHLVLGGPDSRTYGAAASGTSSPKWLNAYPGRIRRKLDKLLGVTSGTGICPLWDQVFGTPAHDPRFTWGSGVTSMNTYGTSPAGNGPLRAACAILDNSAGNGWVAFAPTQQVNRLTALFTARAGATGLATIKVDGASVGTLSLAPVASGGTLTRRAGLPSNVIAVDVDVPLGMHTLRVEGPAGELADFIWAEGDSGVGVRVSSMARSSTTLTHLVADDPNHRYGLPLAVDVPKADLYGLMPMSNDRAQTPAAVRDWVATVVDRQRAAGGDFLLILPCRPDFTALDGAGVAASREANWTAIAAELYALAVTKDFPVIDLTWSWTNFATANARGKFGDSIHENDLGSESIASTLINATTRL